MPGTIPGMIPGKSKIDQWIIFILKEEPINFHSRGQQTFSDQNQESYANFTVDLRKNWFLMTSSAKYDDVIKKQNYNKTTAKFGGVCANTSADNRGG